MSVELKPCPFCGCEDLKLLDAGEFFTSSIVCCGCWIEVVEPSSAPMIEAWNRRAPSPDMREAVEALIEQAVRSAEIEWSYREDDNRYPRDFWHARISWAAFSSGWDRYGEQEQRDLPEATKQEAETELREMLRAALHSLTGAKP